MRLSFSLPSHFSHERLRGLFELLGSALAGRPLALVRREHREGLDPNHANACFFSRWSDGEAVFEHSVETAEGNPRDGYPYLHSAQLTLLGRVLRASDSGGSAHVSALVLEVEPCSGLEWFTLRGLLRRELGAEHDRCSRAWVEPAVLRARAEQLESLLKQVRLAIAGLVDFDMWERWGASSATPEKAAEMHAQYAECRKNEAASRAALEALIVETRAQLPSALEVWAGQHDAYQAERQAEAAARDDRHALSGARLARERWDELRAGTRDFVEEAVSWPSDRDRYFRIFGVEP